MLRSLLFSHTQTYLEQGNVIVVRDVQVVHRVRYDRLHLHLLSVVRVRAAPRNAELYRPVVDVAHRVTGGRTDMYTKTYYFIATGVGTREVFVRVWERGPAQPKRVREREGRRRILTCRCSAKRLGPTGRRLVRRHSRTPPLVRREWPL